MSGGHNMYQAWREFEAFAVPVTAEGEKAMQRRRNQFEAGWSSAIKNVLRVMEIQHEAAKDNHNFWMYAANLIKTELVENHWKEKTNVDS